MKISYSWLSSYFDKEIPSPEKVEELLSVRSFEPEGIEVVHGDSVLDFDVLPNRAHDALCHRGVARELSAVIGQPLKTDRYRRREVEEISDVVSVDIKDTAKCRRYISRVIRDVKIAETPDWLKDQLIAIGQKSINNVVDSTNYVMFDLGQPLHAFDLDKVSGGIVVRNAKDGEHIDLLGSEKKKLDNGKEVDFTRGKILSSNDLIIADEKGSLAIAGVKGGNKAEVDSGTASIVLESANFDPLSVRQTARRTGIQTDSSKRFENEPTRELCLEAMERVTDLIVELCPDAKIGPLVDVYPDKEESIEVSVSLGEIHSLVGVNIPKEKVSEIFDALQLPHSESSDLFTVQVPDFRLDIQIKQDLIEEIARMYGFEHIPATLPEGFTSPVLNKAFYYSGVIREVLAEEGFFEVYTYNFWDKGDIKTLNAIASDKDHLRPSLYRGMNQSLSKNMDHRDFLGVDELRIFEIGKVFAEKGEYLALGLGISELIHPKEKIKNRGLEILDTFIQKLGDRLAIDISKYKESVEEGVLQINFDAMLKDLADPKGSYTFLQSQKRVEFKNFSLQPAMTRDVSVWLPNKDEKASLEEILSDLPLSVKDPRMVDEFEKEGRVSYLYRLVFQADDRTLTDDEVNALLDGVYEKIKSHSDWELR